MVDDDSVCGRDGYAEGWVCEGMGMWRDGRVVMQRIANPSR